MDKSVISSIISMGVTLLATLILVLRFSRETKDRQKIELDRQAKDVHEAETKGQEEGRRKECEERMRQSLDSAHNKIRNIETSIQADRQRQAEQSIEINAKLDNLTMLFGRMESEILGRIGRLEKE